MKIYRGFGLVFLCSGEVSFIFLLTVKRISDNMKVASYEGRFILQRSARMKTRVKEFRTAQKLTQQQLADLVHVSSRTIISIEKGQYNPSLMLAYRMAQVFDVSVEELCCLAENMREEDKLYEDL